MECGTDLLARDSISLVLVIHSTLLLVQWCPARIIMLTATFVKTLGPKDMVGTMALSWIK